MALHLGEGGSSRLYLPRYNVSWQKQSLLTQRPFDKYDADLLRFVTKKALKNRQTLMFLLLLMMIMECVANTVPLCVYSQGSVT